MGWTCGIVDCAVGAALAVALGIGWVTVGYCTAYVVGVVGTAATGCWSWCRRRCGSGSGTAACAAAWM